MSFINKYISKRKGNSVSKQSPTNLILTNLCIQCGDEIIFLDNIYIVLYQILILCLLYFLINKYIAISIYYY